MLYQGRNQGRIRYTGQVMLTEAGEATGINQILYNYKARIYAPKLGRFLQSDPIGTADGSNLYAYVANDPINRVDPTGLAADAIGGIVQGGFDMLYSVVPPSASWRPSNTGSAAYMQGYSAAPQVWAEFAFGVATMGVGTEASAVNGVGSLATGRVGPIAGGGASLDNLTTNEITRIQNAANRTNTPITVVGSRANGTARANSDWDFVLPVGTPRSTRHSLSGSLPEGPRGLGEPRNQDFFTSPVNPDLPHITFPPAGN